MKWNKNNIGVEEAKEEEEEETWTDQWKYTSMYSMERFYPTCLLSSEARDFCVNIGHPPVSENYHFNYSCGLPPSPCFLLKPHARVRGR